MLVVVMIFFFTKSEAKQDNPPTRIGVWQGAAMDSPKFYLGPPCPTLLCPAGDFLWPSMAMQGWPARPQDGQPAAVFHPFGHPTPYAYASHPHVGFRPFCRSGFCLHCHFVIDAVPGFSKVLLEKLD
jgi:hypothetical protein